MVAPKKKVDKSKKPVDAKKDLEDKTFGMKNKKKNRDLKKQIEKLTVTKKKEEPEKIKLNQPKAPIGVDPKSIMCVYYLNKMCDKGDKCKYGHEKPKIVKQEHAQSDLVCRFLIDALNENTYSANWVCPINCKDIHELKNMEDKLSLEEFIEIRRLGCEGEPMTKEEFVEWKRKKKLEDEMHKMRVKAMKSGLTGTDLFKERPDVFVDDEEALEVDYTERNYETDEEDEEQTEDAVLNTSE